jgi:putative ATPase
MHNNQPLAFRMRPTHIDEIVGQKHIIGENTGLYKMIKSGKVPSMLLYGEPGIGKTSIANAIAGTTHMNFELINATNTGKKDIEEVIKNAFKNGPTVLAIDEVHRLTAPQIEVLLPHTESGLITLIAMTTGNPFHSVLPSIRSRCGTIKQLKRLEPEDIVVVLKRAIADKARGITEFDVEATDEVLNLIATGTNGEVRAALNVLELAVYASDKLGSGRVVLLKETVMEFLENKGFSHDRDGDAHYNVLSSFQKSIRGSDVNASLHYLARLIEAGDDTSIIRRLKVIAFEDIGIADPEAVIFTCMACDSVRELGFPEARIPLANAVVRLCLSPKSNSAYVALDAAIADIKAGNIGEIPMHLRDSHYASASKLGHGQGYLYPHNYQHTNFGGWVAQQYLPDLLKDREYFEPKDAGKEKQLGVVHKGLKDIQNKKK